MTEDPEAYLARIEAELRAQRPDLPPRRRFSDAEREAAVLQLSNRERAIFIAHRGHGMRYAEIAAATGITVAAVERTMARALLRLLRAFDRIERRLGGRR